MLKNLCKIFLLSLLLNLAVFGRAWSASAEYSSSKVNVSLLTNTHAVNYNQDLQVLIKFEIAKDWHILSPVPGDIGLPTVITWQLPEGYELIDARWSAAQKFGEEPIIQYGYVNEAYYLATIRPDNNHIHDVSFRADISWQACNDECIPQETVLKFKMPITMQNVIPTGKWYQKLQAAEKTFMLNSENSGRIPVEEPDMAMILLMAFAGGLILNLMPCIFPILSLKAISLVKNIHNRKQARIDALLYFGGVLFSFLVMAMILVWLRTRGDSVGWGFQLQSPAFVIILIGIFLLIMLMLLDVIGINNPFADKLSRISMRAKRLSSFLTGVFSVIIATPCTAPFMGIAIGYTLTKPLYVYYPVFLALGTGYALPFTLVGFFPKVLSNMLPKPGKWMVVLKRLFAVPVFLTCVWLGWVLYNQVTVNKTVDEFGLEWRPYEAEQVRDAVNSGRKVFVDFTAKWCLTCLANEKIALQTEEFAKLVREKDILLFKADWTSRDDKITEALEHYGRNSIPLYVYYNGSDGSMKVLPQLLTPGIVKEELK